MYKNLSILFQKSDYKRLTFLIMLLVLAAFIEMIGIGLVMPIVNVLSNPEIVETSKYYKYAYTFFESTSVNDFVIKASLFLIGYLICKNLFLTGISFFQSYFIARKEAEVSTKLLKSYLNMPYEEYIKRNSADLLRNINQETNQLFINVISSSLILISEAFVAIALLLMLLFIYPMITIISIGFATMAALLFIYIVKGPLTRLGKKRINARGRMLEWATHGLHGLKELVVANRTYYLVEEFNKKSKEMAETQGFSEALSRIPRLYIETIAILLLLIVVVYIMQTGENFIQAISLFGMVMFRMLPSINRIAVSATRVKFYIPSIEAVVNDLKNCTSTPQSSNSITFTKEFKVENLHYKYEGSDTATLKNVSLTVKKGQSISIKGPSGAGKSTLFDIMLGLIKPHKGTLKSDGVEVRENLQDWRQNVSYLPQFVYLITGTIRENIAFGVDAKDIDDEKINKMLKVAELYDFVQTLPQGLDTMIGDITSKLSGGQRQRVGIARALYHNRRILFLDEATASLDLETEKRICNTLKKLTPEITIIAISHRQALLDMADEVYELNNGKISLVKA